MMTPLKFLPIEEFEKQQKSIDKSKALALKDFISEIKINAIDSKRKAKALKEKGNAEFLIKKYVEAEKC